MLNLSRILFLVCITAISCLAQAQTTPLTSATFFRHGYFINPTTNDVVFTFKLSGANTEINGGINGFSGINRTDSSADCCFYGKRFVLRDFAVGRNNFQQTSEPIIVNGRTYNTVYFSGEIIFTGGTTVPFYLKKKQNQVLKFPVSTEGYLYGYATLADRNGGSPLFQSSLKMSGTATVIIRRNEQSVLNRFDIVSVKYDLVTPTN